MARDIECWLNQTSSVVFQLDSFSEIGAVVIPIGHVPCTGWNVDGGKQGTDFVMAERELIDRWTINWQLAELEAMLMVHSAAHGESEMQNT